MPLPEAIRANAPGFVRNSVRLRAAALWGGLIPPRAMHSDAEAALLAEMSRASRSVVEIGVYEGSSAVVLCGAMRKDAALHLVDPFTEGGSALRPGQRAVPAATRRAVERSRTGAGPELCWHLEFSQELARSWSEVVDLIFIDGDHSEAGCREDWELWNGFVGEEGTVVFHDARSGHEGGVGLPGPTAVVDSLFRGSEPLPGWRIVAECDSAVAVARR
ncbi:MAG: hypothetical protein F2813_04935 [Actinobacteria bacterium]|uniref:Unannotated protein n=1 Tax=freshwater metagenome TaxID=449393 RepID=A0A6J5ZRV7_9ZZZZ|nr:hypothetical protein [Actinomycetota bacterium]